MNPPLLHPLTICADSWRWLGPSLALLAILVIAYAAGWIRPWHRRTRIGPRQLSDTLSEIARELNTAPDLDRALNLVLSSMERVIALDSGSILLLEDDCMRVVASRGFQNTEHVLSSRLD